MSFRLDCFNLEHFVEKEESARNFVMMVAHEGKPIRAYSGLYFNKWYKNLQFVVGSVIRHEE